PPHFGPCAHTIRGEDLVASVGMGKIGCGGYELRGRPGRSPLLGIAKAAGGVGGWGGRFSLLKITTRPITRSSAFGDTPYPLVCGALLIPCPAGQGCSRLKLCPLFWCRPRHRTRRGWHRSEAG